MEQMLLETTFLQLKLQLEKQAHALIHMVTAQHLPKPLDVGVH